MDAPIVEDALALRPEATSAALTLPVIPEAMKEYRGHIKWMGYRNIALTVTFNDGVKWLARVRLNDIYTPAVRRSIMLSEYATLEALHEIVPELVPRVYLPPQGKSSPPARLTAYRRHVRLHIHVHGIRGRPITAHVL